MDLRAKQAREKDLIISEEVVEDDLIGAAVKTTVKQYTPDGEEIEDVVIETRVSLEYQEAKLVSELDHVRQQLKKLENTTKPVK